MCVRTHVCILCVPDRRSKKVRKHAVHYVKEVPEADTNDAEPEYVEYGIEHNYCMAFIFDVAQSLVTSCCKPLITSLPKDTTVMEGTRVEFPVQVIGTPHPTLTWYHNNTCVNNDYAHEISSNGTLTIVNTEMKHSGNYQLVATNSVGSVEGKFTLKIVSKTPLIPPPSAAGSHPVPIAVFGQYVSQNHANSNNRFIELYHVSHFFMYIAELLCDMHDTMLNYLFPVP